MRMTHISHGHYRISDTDANRLARQNKVRLPRPGWAVRVALPDGRLAELMRTPYRHYTDSPKRGWVWAVMPTGGKG